MNLNDLCGEGYPALEKGYVWVLWDDREDEKAYLLVFCISLWFKGTGKASRAAFSLD